ncbi:hypothetical protein ACFLXA_06315 [Chloroflexota bacterium]
MEFIRTRVILPIKEFAGTKSGRRLLIMLFTGLFLIGVVYLGLAYMDELQEKRDNEDELALVQEQISRTKLAILQSEQTIQGLEDEVTQNEAQLADIRAQLTYRLVISEVFRYMFEVAGDAGVSLNIIGTSGPANTTFAGVSYRAMSISFTVTGNASNIYNFVEDISYAFDTGVLNTLSTGGSSAQMQLTIYSVS